MTDPGGLQTATETGGAGTTGGPAADRWWRRDTPRTAAAVLLLVLGVVHVAAAAVLGVWSGVPRNGVTFTVLYALPSLGGALVAVGAAALLMSGSRGARTVAALTAVGLGVQTVAPLLAARPLGAGAGLGAAAVALLVLAAVAAAALPLPARAPATAPEHGRRPHP